MGRVRDGDSQRCLLALRLGFELDPGRKFAVGGVDHGEGAVDEIWKGASRPTEIDASTARAQRGKEFLGAGQLQHQGAVNFQLGLPQRESLLEARLGIDVPLDDDSPSQLDVPGASNDVAKQSPPTSAQRRLQLLPTTLADRDVATAGQHRIPLSRSVGAQRLDPVQVHDVRPMNPQEARRVEPRCQLGDGR